MSGTPAVIEDRALGAPTITAVRDVESKKVRHATDAQVLKYRLLDFLLARPPVRRPVRLSRRRPARRDDALAQFLIGRDQHFKLRQVRQAWTGHHPNRVLPSFEPIMHFLADGVRIQTLRTAEPNNFISVSTQHLRDSLGQRRRCFKYHIPPARRRQQRGYDASALLD